MTIEANNKKQTAAIITKNTILYGSNKYSFNDYFLLTFYGGDLNVYGEGFNKWNKLISKIRRRVC